MYTSEQLDQAYRGARPQPRTASTAGNRSSVPAGYAAVLRLQRAAGNAAVSHLVAPDSPVTAVQRCGSVPPDQCPCHSKDEGQPT